jgi:hypothetical protein
MAENTYTFHEGERFDGQFDDETIIVREVRTHTIVRDYVVDGDTIGRNTIAKDRAQKYVQFRYWKPRRTN